MKLFRMPAPAASLVLPKPPYKILSSPCLVAEPDKVLVGELNEWVANPLGPGQTSALQIKTRSAYLAILHNVIYNS